MNIDHITGLILCGGQGSRMGGLDKGWQLLHGDPLVRHAMRRLAPQVGPMAISANRNLAAYAELGVPVWPDTQQGFAGPLAGLQAGLAHCSTPWLLCAPCDSPFMPADLVVRLASALESGNADIAVAVTGSGEQRRAHPVFCLMKSSVRPHLDAYLAAGKRRFDAWYATLVVAETEFPDEANFRNINTPQDLRHCEG
jgi:molybdopterin-guanine dinucleotide biosynthesis protein A